ncbi:MAG TPA: signal peptidase I [Pyrinomonadaceae bacterium]|jgi:signal peptidase I|nr:signal peptidase I [Pyrinomonadaceae bacterium]
MKLIACILGSLVMLVAGCSPSEPGLVLPVRIEGVAMSPALHDGDRIFINRGFAKLERGDIVVFYHPDDHRKSYIKRVVGLPNEKVEIRERKVFVNGMELAETYVDPKNNEVSRGDEDVVVPADSFYVMGDNRDNSADSRMFGALPRNLIYGKFVGKYYSAE